MRCLRKVFFFIIVSMFILYQFNRFAVHREWYWDVPTPSHTVLDGEGKLFGGENGIVSLDCQRCRSWPYDQKCVTDPLNASRVSTIQFPPGGLRSCTKYVFRISKSAGNFGSYFRFKLSGRVSFSSQQEENPKEYVFQASFPVPGKYTLIVLLESVGCLGWVDPPNEWFRLGTRYGRMQPDGVLGNFSTFVGAEVLRKNIQVLERVGNDTCEVVGETLPGCLYVNHPPVGYWMDNEWVTSMGVSSASAIELGHSNRARAAFLWVYGDSTSRRFYDWISQSRICLSLFQSCRRSYVWIYNNEQKPLFPSSGIEFNETAVLKEMSLVLEELASYPGRNMFLFNMGLHYLAALSFDLYLRLMRKVADMVHSYAQRRGPGRLAVVWRTTNMVSRERSANLTRTHLQFLSNQKIAAANAVVTRLMCDRGIPVLDVQSMTASYPAGPIDHVHYNISAMKAAITSLESFIVQWLKDSTPSRIPNKK